MSSKKVRKPVNIEPELYDEIDLYLEKAGAKSKSEFIRDAVWFYINYHRTEKSIDFISPMINDIMKNNLDYFRDGMSEMLFKLAVQVSKLNLIVADDRELSMNDFTDLNTAACEYVAENNGVLDFEDAYYMQKYSD